MSSLSLEKIELIFETFMTILMVILFEVRLSLICVAKGAQRAKFWKVLIFQKMWLINRYSKCQLW